jgi:hypothetical protein
VLRLCRVQLLLDRLRWDDPPDKHKVYPDAINGEPTLWSDEGRKKMAKVEARDWSASLDSPLDVEAAAKVR